MGYKKCIVATSDNELFATIKKQIGNLLPIMRFTEIDEIGLMLDSVSTDDDEIVIVDNFFFGCKTVKYMKFLLSANSNTRFFFCCSNNELPIHYGLHLQKTVKAAGGFGLNDFMSDSFHKVLSNKIDSYFPAHIKNCWDYNIRDISHISEHEIEIANLFSKGLTEKAIASKFAVTTSSISSQLTHFKRKAGLESRFDIFRISQVKDVISA